MEDIIKIEYIDRNVADVQEVLGLSVVDYDELYFENHESDICVNLKFWIFVTDGPIFFLPRVLYPIIEGECIERRSSSIGSEIMEIYGGVMLSYCESGNIVGV